MVLSLLRKVYSFLIDTIQSLLIAAFLFLVIYLFFLKPFEVKGDSMVPNFENNEYVLTNIVGLHFGDPKLGDVVVFRSPENPQVSFIKRIIGTPGDEVEIRDGQVIINGKILDESEYLPSNFETTEGEFSREGESITVPEESYFVLGDNRSFSSDSRTWGFVKREMITGYSLFVYWPLSRIRVIENPLEN